MAKNSSNKNRKEQYWPSGQKKLTFYDLIVPKDERKEVEKRLSTGEISIKHLDQVLGDNDKLSIKRDANGGGWSAFLTWTPDGEDEPVGVYTTRAKHLSNAIAALIWRSEDFDARHFSEEPDDDF